MFRHRKLSSVLLSFVVIFSLTLSGFQPVSVSAQGGDGIKRQVNIGSGRVSFIGPESGLALSALEALGTFSRPTDPAMALAKRFGPEFGLKNPGSELSEMKTSRPEDGRVTVRYQQNYQGIPVMGAELIVNTNQNGDLYSMNGEVSPDLSLQTQPKIDSAQARDSALRAIAKYYQKSPADFVASEPELWIFDESLLQPSTRPVELVWRIEVTAVDDSMPVRELVLVDAQKGGISLHFNQIDTAWTSAMPEPIQQDPDVTPAKTPISTEPPIPTETPLPIETRVPTEPPALSDASSLDVDALVVTTWYVATTGNDSNSCTATGFPCLTINGAIGKAAASGDTIEVAVGTYTGTGTEVVLINKSVTISGGWNASFTTQSGTSTVDGQGARRGVTVNSGVTSSAENFTIQNGSAPSFYPYKSGGIYNDGSLTLNNLTVTNSSTNVNSAGIYSSNILTLTNGNITSNLGRGISNIGNMTLVNTTISNNSEGGIGNSGTLVFNNSLISSNVYYGGISNSGNLTLNNSTVSGNTSQGSSGGAGIGNWGGILVLNNSTVSGNIASNGGFGGGIQNTTTDGTVTINNSTITGNMADSGPGGISGVMITIQNSVIAGNRSQAEVWDCYGQITSLGYNLIGNNSGCTFSATTGDLVGTSASPINPRLTPLQDNGGTTLTHALMVGSPAINAGNPATPGSGGNACLATDQRGNVRPVAGRCDIGAYEGSVAWVPSPLVNTYTTGGTSSLPGTFLCNQTQPNCTNNANPHADAAHKYAIGTYNFYATQFNRDSIDNNGMTIVSTVHYQSGYDNAFWSGAQIVYGDATDWPYADDMVAHELTHGVTQYESNLFYFYQSGAINESLSDLWGEYYDQTNGFGTDTPSSVRWLLGEDTLPGGTGAIRNMSNPPAFGDPDKMTSPNYYTGPLDYGGVHWNSGVNNKAVFLMVDGGTFNGKTVSALGWDKTAAIYYEVNTSLLSSGADYSDLYYAIQQACTYLIGQHGVSAGDCMQVKNAIDAVEMNSQPVANFNPDALICPPGVSVNPLFEDNMESGTGKWSMTGAWSIESGYASSPIHMLYGDDFYTSNDSSATMATGVALPVAPDMYLHFRHAFGYENDVEDYYDGGVLEYSVNNGGSWVDASPLFTDGQNYKGTILNYPGTSNVLNGRSAFVGDSHGYVSSRYDLTSLGGQTVKFRWRFATDESVFYLGWVVDDIQIYTCDNIPFVSSVVRANANPTIAGSVNFTVTFSESVTGVDMAGPPFDDFSLTKTGGIIGEAVSGVSGTDNIYTVTVGTGSGLGTIRLNLVDDDTIVDLTSNPLGGAGAGNGNFNSGQTYNVVGFVYTLFLPLILR